MHPYSLNNCSHFVDDIKVHWSFNDIKAMLILYYHSISSFYSEILVVTLMHQQFETVTVYMIWYLGLVCK